MPSFNKVLLMGNLTRDPETRYTPSGASIVNISIAVNEKYKAQSGEIKENVSFIECIAWNKKGEAIAQYLRKGSPIHIEGKLKQESWQDKNTGQNRSKIVVNIDNFNFIGGGQGNQPGTAGVPPAKLFI